MEKYEVKIFSTAKQDLLEIIDYLNTLSPETALRYYDKLTEEIGGLAVFLCTDFAQSITGAALPVEGGWTAQ